MITLLLLGVLEAKTVFGHSPQYNIYRSDLSTQERNAIGKLDVIEEDIEKAENDGKKKLTDDEGAGFRRRINKIRSLFEKYESRTIPEQQKLLKSTGDANDAAKIGKAGQEAKARVEKEIQRVEGLLPASTK